MVKWLFGMVTPTIRFVSNAKCISKNNHHLNLFQFKCCNPQPGTWDHNTFSMTQNHCSIIALKLLLIGVLFYKKKHLNTILTNLFWFSSSSTLKSSVLLKGLIKLNCVGHDVKVRTTSSHPHNSQLLIRLFHCFLGACCFYGYDVGDGMFLWPFWFSGGLWVRHIRFVRFTTVSDVDTVVWHSTLGKQHFCLSSWYHSLWIDALYYLFYGIFPNRRIRK